MDITTKYERLTTILAAYETPLIAFSGGADSALLLAAANEACGERAAAVTVRGMLFPAKESKAAEDFCKERGIRHFFVGILVADFQDIRDNPKDRCYICKRKIFRKILHVAHENGFSRVAEGSNKDDTEDYRPGLKAARELRVHSPLIDAGFTKNEVREISKKLGLPTWDKPSLACLASRIPYGEAITREKLTAIEQAEDYLRTLGVCQVRVRHHGAVARIETDEDGFRLLSDAGIRKTANAVLNAFGFRYSALDLFGYRSGSMNE